MDVLSLLRGLPSGEQLPISLFRGLAATEAVAVVDAESGTVYRYRDIARRADRVSAALRQIGVRAGERVVWTAPTSVDSIAIWMGIAQIGAVDVCIGEALKGHLLAHMMGDCSPTAAVVHHRSTGGVALLAEEQTAPLRGSLVITPDGQPDPGSTSGAFAGVDLSTPAETAALSTELTPDGLATIIYTSGTTGPSKGVMLCHHQQLFVGANLVQQWQVHRGATLYHYSPFNHVTGRQLVVAAMLVGGTLIMRERFSLARFWPDINSYCVTHAITLGSAVPLLLDQQGPQDANAGSLRNVWASPAMPGPYRKFASRFGVRVFTPYGSTEVGIVVAPSVIPGDEGPPGNSGRQGEHFQLAILDEADQRVPTGTVGEIAVRPTQPWSTYLGYLNRDDATRVTNRNMWYHSGDFGRMDADGYLFFADRKQDFLRSKGENISSSEIEQVLLRHPGVADAAIIPIPSELADEEVCAVVERSSTDPFDPLEFYRWCASELPYFMVPRYIRTVEELPRGSSGKVEKYKLRRSGIDADTWDAAAQGMRAGRSGIVSTPPVDRPAVERLPGVAS